MRLKAMEKIDESKDNKHTGKLTDNPKDRTLYIVHVRCDVHRPGRATVLNLSERARNEIKTLSNEWPMFHLPESCLSFA